MCITNIGQKNLSTNKGYRVTFTKAQVSGSMARGFGGRGGKGGRMNRREDEIELEGETES